jgi:hypothetical protein
LKEEQQTAERGSERELDNLSSTLESICTSLPTIDEQEQERQARFILIESLNLYRQSRRKFGKALASYRDALKPDGAWTKACLAIAMELQCDERTVRRIIEDYERIADVPESILTAMDEARIDPAARKNERLLDQVVQLIPNECEPTPEQAAAIVKEAVTAFADPRDQYEKPNPGEKRLHKIRMGIRKGLNDITDDDKQATLIQAIEEEAWDVWGVQKPFTLEINPHPGTITIDGRKLNGGLMTEGAA